MTLACLLLAVVLPGFGGQLSEPRGVKFMGSNELLSLVDWAEVANC